MQTWFINGRNMTHAEVLRWRAGQAEPEVVEPTEAEKLEKQIKDMPSVQEVKVGEVTEEVKEPTELGEAETPKIVKPFCEFCDSRGVRHKKDCPTLLTPKK